MSQNLNQAYRQWLKRQPDERFSSLDDIYSFTRSRKENSIERITNLAGLSIEDNGSGGLYLNGNSNPAYISHWAFGQLCNNLGAPAKYLRSLPTSLVKNCLQHGLTKSKQRRNILTRNYDGNTESDEPPIISAFTGETYGRIWDYKIIDKIQQATVNSPWHPPISDRKGRRPTGLYASDHDMFIFLINDENPIKVNGTRLGRGFFCWNSETGSATFGLTTFLYNYMCDNHIVYGADQIRELKIIHRNKAVERFREEALPALYNFVSNREFGQTARSAIEKSMNTRIGKDLEETLKWFKDKSFTNSEIRSAWKRGEEEGEDVSTAWGIIQGLTYHARDMKYTDQRVSLERRAGRLLNSKQK